MTLSEKLKLIYPELDSITDVFLDTIILQDDGQGAYIKEWKYTKPQPTQDELDSII
jgi:hypothetical protein